MNDQQWTERAINEQDATIERLQRRIEDLERITKAILTALSIKVVKHERTKPTTRKTTRRKG